MHASAENLSVRWKHLALFLCYNFCMFKRIFENQRTTTYLSAFIGAASAFGLMQFLAKGRFADPDGFYHAKVSQLLSAGRLSDTFPWMQFTTWKSNFADQHYLYHWLLIPFNDIHRMQISIFVFGLVFLITFAYVLNSSRTRWNWLWFAVLLFGSVDFLFRVNLVKANTLSLAFLFLLIALIHSWHDSKSQRKSMWLLAGMAGISALFVWTYGGFLFVPFLVLAYCVAATVKNRHVVIFPLLAVLAGIGLGIILHPHHSHFLQLMYDQLFRTGLGAGTVVPAGGEWKPFNLDWLIKSNIPLLAIWLTAILLEAKVMLSKRLPEWRNLWIHAAALGLFALTLWHRRFIEYFVPFAVLASAISLTPYFAQVSWQKFANAWNGLWELRLYVSVMGIVIVMAFGYSYKQVYGSLNYAKTADQYEQAGKWMADHSEKGDIVFNTQWDEFPGLFYWDDRNYYLVGMDPTFMYIHNPDLYWKWRAIADDQPDDGNWGTPERMSEIFKRDFDAKFVFVDSSRNPNIYNRLKAEPERYVLGFDDNDMAVFTVK